MKVGDKFGRLVVLELFSERRPSASKARKFKTRGMARCLCDCGAEVTPARSDLKSGHTESCGCLNREETAERNLTHGMSKHWLYRRWAEIKTRCTNPNATHYAYYGGRGITMAPEWRDDPAAFIEWAQANGAERYLEVDRIDPDEGYSPDNCRFITAQENSQRRRNARCTVEQARQVRKHLHLGSSVMESAALAGVPYMSAWHISKGNTWNNA